MPLRGSVFFRVFRVFRGFENIIRAHSCPFVVLAPHRLLFPCVPCVSWFCIFYSCPFVSIRGSVFSRVFRGSIPLVPLAMTMMIIFPFA